MYESFSKSYEINLSLDLASLNFLSPVCSSLSQPLEVLELPYLCLTSTDLAYLSCSQHAPFLRELDLSENWLDESSLPSLRRLLAQAESSLRQLSLCGCGLSDTLLVLFFPPCPACRALRSLRLALNPLSRMGLLSWPVQAAGIPSLRLLLYPTHWRNMSLGCRLSPPVLSCWIGLCERSLRAETWRWGY